ncbi:MAG TPA: GNAT family N-acetyltransferase [Acidimicrobiales bacterium]|nr:GNAT family N-acetyltransferase [Acidimicrobiales bacterium]
MEAARVAVGADGDRCGQLCRQALNSLQEVRGGSLFTRRETGLVAKALLRPGGLDRLLADGRRRVLVGTVDDAVVGLALGRVDPVGESSLGIVDAFYVEPGARGVGVGRALLDDLVGWFASSGCRGVDVTALPGDRATKNLLEGSGFKARLLTMHRTLP